MPAIRLGRDRLDDRGGSRRAVGLRLGSSAVAWSASRSSARRSHPCQRPRAPPPIGDRLDPRRSRAGRRAVGRAATSSSGEAAVSPSPSPQSSGRPLSPMSTCDASTRPWVMPISCRSARVDAAPATMAATWPGSPERRQRPPAVRHHELPSVATGALRTTDTTPGWLAWRSRSPSRRRASTAAPPSARFTTTAPSSPAASTLNAHCHTLKYTIIIRRYPDEEGRGGRRGGEEGGGESSIRDHQGWTTAMAGPRPLSRRSLPGWPSRRRSRPSCPTRTSTESGPSTVTSSSTTSSASSLARTSAARLLGPLRVEHGRCLRRGTPPRRARRWPDRSRRRRPAS